MGLFLHGNTKAEKTAQSSVRRNEENHGRLALYYAVYQKT